MPTFSVLFPSASIFLPFCGSPADCVSPVGFASPDRSGFAVVTKCLFDTGPYKAVIRPTLLCRQNSAKAPLAALRQEGFVAWNATIAVRRTTRKPGLAAPA